MKIKLVKGNEAVHVHIGKDQATVKTTVDGRESTSHSIMTPLEANRKVNELIRKGYTKAKN